MVLEMLCSMSNEITKITYNWIPKERKNLTSEHVKVQLSILGMKELSEEDVEEYKLDMMNLFSVVITLAKAKITQIIIEKAQKEGIKYNQHTPVI